MFCEVREGTQVRWKQPKKYYTKSSTLKRAGPDLQRPHLPKPGSVPYSPKCVEGKFFEGRVIKGFGGRCLVNSEYLLLLLWSLRAARSRASLLAPHTPKRAAAVPSGLLRTQQTTSEVSRR